MKLPKFRSPSLTNLRPAASLLIGIFSLYASGGVPLYAETVTGSVSPTTSGGTSSTASAEEPSTISLDFKDADINTVLRVMSLKSKVNIVAGPEVKGTVTIRLENVPWDRALNVVLRTYGYVYEREGNIIRVTTRENLATEDVVTQTFVLNYSTAEEVEESVKEMLTERGRIKSSPRSNMVIISDIPTNLYQIGEVIRKMDLVTPQAFIDSKIIKTDVGIAENLGIAWNVQGALSGANRPTTFPFTQSTRDGKEDIGQTVAQFFPVLSSGTTAERSEQDIRAFPHATTATPTNSTFQFGTLSTSAFTSTLLMLKSRTNTKVVSNPRIVVLNNQAAKVQVGEQIPIPTFERNETTGSLEVSGYSYRDVGVVMNVTPHINSQEEILVDLKPEVSSMSSIITFSSTLFAPSFTVTQAVTQVLIRSGETIAIGGLLTDNITTSEAKVPYLGDVPFIGKIFRSKRQTAGTGNAKVETLFFVTVTMVDAEGQPTGGRGDGRDQAGGGQAGQANQNNANPPQEEKVEASGPDAAPDSKQEPQRPEQTKDGQSGNDNGAETAVPTAA